MSKNSKSEFELEQARNTFRSRGKCPSSDQLVRYQQRALNTEEMLIIKQHLDLCGFCDWAVTQLGEIESIETNEIKPRQIRSLLRLFLHPAFAYVIILGLLYPAYRGIFQTRPTVERTAGSARNFDLGEGATTRSASTSKKTVVTLTPSENFFILSLFATIRSSDIYEMEIKNEKGQKMDSGEIHSRDTLGNFSIVCSSNLFPDGNYELMIKGTEKQTHQIKDEYRFLFRVERHQR